MTFPILQFGTSRFLQAHFDLFVDQGYVDGSGKGRIARRADDLVARERAPARLLQYRGSPMSCAMRGLEGERLIDEEVASRASAAASTPTRTGRKCERLFNEARWVVSNTGDRGYELSEGESAGRPVPRAFPAKLAKLLSCAFRAGAAPLDVFPLRADRGQRRQAARVGAPNRARMGAAAGNSSVGRANSASGSIRSSTASSPSRSSPPARSPSPMRSGRWRTAPGLAMPCAPSRASSSPTISSATSG